jgi:hypothetical protein
MKINEIINEANDNVPADAKKLHHAQVSSLKGAVSMPDISNNKSFSSAYAQMRYYTALAGAHSDKAKSEQMPAVGAIAGDPLGLSYTDEEAQMMANALEMVNGGRIIPVGSRRSEEGHDVHKASPVRVRVTAVKKKK